MIKILCLLICLNSHAASLKETIRRVYLSKRISNSSEKLKIEKTNYLEAQEAQISLDFKALSTFESNNNLLVIENEAYDVEGEDENLSHILGSSISYRKTLWSGGQDEKFEEYIGSKKVENRELDKKNEIIFNKALVSNFMTLFFLEERLDLEKVSWRWLSKVHVQIKKLSKARLVSRISKSKINAQVKMKSLDIMKVKMLLESKRNFLKQSLGINTFNKLYSLINKKRVGSKRKKICKEKTNKHLDYQLARIKKERLFKDSQSGMNLQLIGQASVSDINGWNSPSANTSLGIRFSIPLGTTTGMRYEDMIKEREILRRKKKQQLEKNFLDRNEKNVLTQALIQEKVNNIIIKEFKAKMNSYDKAFRSNLLKIDSYLSLYRDYRKSMLLKYNLRKNISRIIIYNEMKCWR
jgi:hypothetical protein